METALQAGINGSASSNFSDQLLARIMNRTREVYKERHKGKGIGDLRL
jgi:hypothetical protein